MPPSPSHPDLTAQPFYLPQLNTYIDHFYIPSTNNTSTSHTNNNNTNHVTTTTNNNNTNIHIIIVPGNPGLYGYYVPMARYIHQALHQHYAIHIFSYAGFSINGVKLNEQIENSDTLTYTC